MKLLFGITISIALFMCGCQSTDFSALTGTVAKVQAWNSSPAGITTLNTVGALASAFGPQYAAPISIGIASLETGKLPTVDAASSVIASMNKGNPNASNAKVLKLATAVVAAAQSAPSVNGGLQSAANVITPPVTKASAQANVQFKPRFRIHMPDVPELRPYQTFII